MAHLLAVFDRLIPKDQSFEGEVNELARDVQRVLILEGILVIVLFILGIIAAAVVFGGFWGATYIIWMFLVAFGFYSVWKRIKSWVFIWIIMSAISILLDLIWVIWSGVFTANLNAACAALNITCPTGWIIVIIIMIVIIIPVEVWSTYLAWRLHPQLDETAPTTTEIHEPEEEAHP
eukprot:TRINITY_DN13253_c0_g2_i1.p1 TRINITY_DN13253_c0_g2~~TRINITY_DN13253_c0_g2_i1.p1  ORF type:complete len:177 (+),score=20.77 TRINITY_DN13253_c0_g2_i1:79-609(+)